MAIVDVRFHFLVEDGIEFLQRYPFEGDELVYCDPPYVRSTRRTPGPVYAFEMTDAQHAALIEAIKRLPCLVMISGYRSKLYAKELSYWNTRAFESMTRGGREATEWVWFNFNEPVALHDYRYLGEGFRERERIKRKMNRWMRRLTSMPILERRALLSALEASGLAIAPTARNGDGRS